MEFADLSVDAKYQGDQRARRALKNKSESKGGDRARKGEEGCEKEGE